MRTGFKSTLLGIKLGTLEVTETSGLTTTAEATNNYNIPYKSVQGGSYKILTRILGRYDYLNLIFKINTTTSHNHYLLWREIYS